MGNDLVVVRRNLFGEGHDIPLSLAHYPIGGENSRADLARSSTPEAARITAHLLADRSLAGRFGDSRVKPSFRPNERNST